MAKLSSSTTSGEVHAEIQREIVGLVLPGLIVLGALLILATEAGRWPWPLHVASLVLIALQALAWLLLPHSYRLAVYVTLCGCVAAGMLAALYAPTSAVLCLLAVPAGVAVLLSGLKGGLAVTALCSLLVIQAPQWLGPSERSVVAPALLIIWATAALAATASLRVSRTLDVLCANYERMHDLLREAREQRVELKQVQEDLVHANAELARLSDRLVQMNQAAEGARRAKEEFVANVSHELRTPLNMIIGFSEMISEAPQAYGADLPAPLLADVDVILRNSRHLASLVDDVLDLSQVEAGRMSISREWVSFPEILEEAVVAVRPLFEAKGLDLRLHCAADLPPLFCDRTRMRQVLLNLVSNAARFTEHGGVEVRAQREADHLTVNVADTGPGIAPENQRRIFEPFQQVDSSTRRRFGGTGLGLSISKRFVEMHGGRMWLESALGEGSTFHFSLPLQEAVAPVFEGPLRWLSPEFAERQRTRPSKAPRVSPAPRFVVLEPGNVLRRLLRRYLEGCEIAAATSLDEAVAELRRSPAQALIVNDPALGDGGAGLTRQAADLPFGTPAVACWVPGEEEAASRLGVARYLLKPVTREALCSALEALGDGVRTVLVADDQTEVLQLIGRLLASTGQGYRTLRASTGQRALELLRERQPDVLLLDLVMAGTDGYAVLQEKKADPRIRDIPVIAISALDPVRGSIIGDALTLVRSGGLTLGDLLACLQLWSQAKNP